MKYTKKVPETDFNLRDELISKGWKKIKEPSNLMLSILLSLPFMFVNGIIFISVAYGSLILNTFTLSPCIYYNFSYM